MKVPLYLLLVYFSYFKLAISENCFKAICIPSEYDKTAQPIIEYEQTYEVNFTNIILVDFENILILRINEKESTITLKLSFSLWWVEPRLTKLPEATQKEKDDLIDAGYYLPKEFTNDLWLPDAYIENVTKINKFNLIREYQALYYLYDYDENSLFRKKRFALNYVDIDQGIHKDKTQTCSE